MSDRKSVPRVLEREGIITTLRGHEEELRQKFGVKSLGLFGSRVRSDATQDSDIDLLVEFDRPVSLFDLVDVQEFLSKLLGGAEVDLVLKRAVIEDLRDIIYGEAIDVFA